jgi:lipoprotein signal peptidase
MARLRRTGWLALAASTAAFDLWTKTGGSFAWDPAKWPWRYPKGPPEPVFPQAALANQVTNETVIERWLYWRTTWNPGGPWSTKLPPDLLLWGTTVAVPLIALWIFWPKRARVGETAAKALVLGGAVGNLFDRWRWGQVRDFIDVRLWGWPYPTFNVADAGLVVGILILLLGGVRRSRPEAP